MVVTQNCVVYVENIQSTMWLQYELREIYFLNLALIAVHPPKFLRTAELRGFFKMTVNFTYPNCYLAVMASRNLSHGD